jgi:hypothetical protein
MSETIPPIGPEPQEPEPEAMPDDERAEDTGEEYPGDAEADDTNEAGGHP